MDVNRRNRRIAVGILIFITACNLRIPITGVGSLISMISSSLGLSSGEAGAVTAIPLLAFAAVSPAVVLVSRWIGAGNLLLLSLVMMNIGILVRSFCGNTGLFAGTVVIGLAIGVGNVLLPAVIKTYFPDRIESMTSMFTVVMQVTSAAGVAVSVPVAEAAGWKWGLAFVIPMSAVAMIFCIKERRIQITSANQAIAVPEKNNKERTSLYRNPLSWWIAIYMGSQSLIFYSFIAWLSPIMQYRGFDDKAAGYILSAYVIMGFMGSAAVPFIMKRNRTQKSTAMQLGFAYFIGIAVMMSGSCFALTFGAILLCGFCSGTMISFAMALFGLHTRDGEDASRLSGLAQSVGYLIAAVGPVLLGQIYDVWGSWTLPLGILAAIALALTAMSRIVGSDEII